MRSFRHNHRRAERYQMLCSYRKIHVSTDFPEVTHVSKLLVTLNSRFNKIHAKFTFHPFQRNAKINVETRNFSLKGWYYPDCCPQQKMKQLGSEKNRKNLFFVHFLSARCTSRLLRWLKRRWSNFWLPTSKPAHKKTRPIFWEERGGNPLFLSVCFLGGLIHSGP